MKNLNRYAPKELNQKISVAELGVECFYSDEKKVAMFFRGKSLKASFYNRFNTIERMHEKINSSIETLRANEQYKIDEKKRKKEIAEKYGADHFFKMGDIIVNSWGYEQTNIEYYQVVKITKKQIRVERIGSEIVEGSTYSHGMACEVAPIKDKFLFDTENERYRGYTLTVKPHNEKSVSLSGGASYYHFYKHSGKSEYKSWYA